jgi:biotin carboxylase
MFTQVIPIPPNYDLMIAKLITTAPNQRRSNKMKRALDEFY